MSLLRALRDTGDAQWGLFPFEDEEEDVYYLTGDPGRPVCPGEQDGAGWPAYILRHPGQPGRPDQWMLFASDLAPVAVNGVSIRIGVRVLADRDEIRVGQCVLLFITEKAVAREGEYCPLPRER